MMYPPDSEPTGKTSQKLAPVSQPALEVVDLCKQFPRAGRAIGPLEVLDGINLEIERGGFVSIVGPSGSGKSTLLNLVSGLDDDFRGSIRLGGDADAARIGRVPYMHQRDLLLPWRTVLENAILSLELRGTGRREAREQALVHFGDFGLADFASAYPAEISGGMRQRVSLLRATLTGGDLLLLDEPFGALDAITRSSMHTWLSGLLSGSGRAVLLVTHDVEEALLLSDRVHVLSSRPGKIVATVEVDLPRPRTARMVTDARFVEMKLRLMDALAATAGLVL